MNKIKTHGQLIVISGPSGCGKDTVVKEVLKTNPNAWLSVSCTSRKPRPGEVNGKDYFFLSRDEFEKKIADGDLLEYAEYAENYYGTPKDIIVEKINQGIDVILVIEIQGALKIKEILKETIFVFILPPTIKELRRRLEGRKTETKEVMMKRFKTAYKEINEVNKYNYVVINDVVEDAATKVNAIITSEKCRVDRIEETFLSSLEEEIHELLISENETIDIK